MTSRYSQIDRPWQEGAFPILIALTLLLLACSPPDTSDTNPPVATVDQIPISAETTDATLRLELHDLDQARYEIRRDRLHALIAERLGADVLPGSPEWNERVEIHLAPPTPPRLEIPDGSPPVRGPTSAPIPIVEFVDYASTHCRRLQPELLRLLERYPDRVRLLVRDLPLPYHRHARDAAIAAHCAGEQGRYEAYADMLLLEQPHLAPPDLVRYATLVGLDLAAFETCIRSGRHDGRIDADLALAATLGVRRAATVFVNGLYMTGQPSFDELDRVVQSELVRLGLDPSPRTKPLASPSDASVQAPDAASPEVLEPPPSDTPALPVIPPDTLPEPEAVITLSRAEVDRALEDRRGLDRKLEASRAEFSGRRLLKIRTVEEADFYARLGLEERDVLLAVNGAFVTVESASIWEAFAKRDTVTLLVMRRGLPHTYEYRIR